LHKLKTNLQGFYERFTPSSRKYYTVYPSYQEATPNQEIILSVEKHEKVKVDCFKPNFKNTIGVIDGSHIPCSVHAEDVVNHTYQHGYTSQNVFAICDFDMRFTFVVDGCPSSAHDIRIVHH
jgi:hypothetical protein